MRIYQIKKRRRQKRNERRGVDCIAAVTDRHAKSALIKGLRLQRQRAQGPALLPPNDKTHQKEGKESTLPLVVLAGNQTLKREKE